MKTQGQGGHTCTGGRVAPANAAKAPGLCAHRVRSGTPAVTLVPQDAVSRAPLNPAGRKGVAFLLDRVHPKSQTPHPDPEKMVTRPNRVLRKYRTDRRVKDPSAQVSPVAQSCPTLATPWTAACQALSITNSWSLLKLMSIESVIPSSHLILCRPLLLPPSIFPSIRVFPNESVLRIRGPKDWSFSLSISPSTEHSGLISFRMDWLGLLAVPSP